MSNEMTLSGVKDGELFELAGIQFIKFPDENGITPVVAKDIQFNSEFGRNNYLAKSVILKRLQDEWLPKVAEAVGEENLCMVKTDLTALDGLTPYEPMESLVSLPTMEFYRRYAHIFDRYNPKRWWWLATPESAEPHDDPDWILCVSPSGCINGVYYYLDYGVRPFLALKSCIFGSSEE